jgi:hypothetical protein
VATGAQDYTATVAPGTIQLADGGKEDVAVSYVGGPLPTLNFRVPSIQLFQSTQNDLNTVPMVANRAAFLRIFALANQPNSTLLKVRVHLFQSGMLVDSIDASGPAAVPTAIDTSSLGASWNANIPASRIVPGFGFDVVADPDDRISEASESDNRFPAVGARVAPVVVTVPVVRVRLVPVFQQVDGRRGNVTSANQGSYTDLARRIYPISQMSVDVRAAFTTSAPTLFANDTNGAWGRILGEMNALRVAEGGNRYYYGVVDPSYNSGIAGLGYVGAPAAIGWDKGSGVGVVAAHELGHNFGRQHAPCGNPSNPDANYPYPGAGIGTWGYDQGSNSLKSPAQFTDLMGYCSPTWISDYTYEGVLAYLSGSASMQPPPVQGLLVWGRIIGDSLVLEPAFRVTAPPQRPTTSGPYRVSGAFADGSAAFDLSFAGDEVPDRPGKPERHFAFVVPMNTGQIAQLAAIRLRGPAREAVQTAQAAAPTDVEVRQAGAGRVDVRWDARYPMAVIRDKSTDEIIAFARGGAATISAAGAVKVELSRGPGSVAAVVRNRK